MARHRSPFCALVGAIAVTSASMSVAHELRPTIKVDRQLECAGVIRAIEPGWLTIEDARGRRARFQMQASNSVGLLLKGGKHVVRFPCDVTIRGETPARTLPVGARITCVAQLHLATRQCSSPIRMVKVSEVVPLGMRWSSTLRSECEISAEVVEVANEKLVVKTTDDGEEVRLRLPLTPDATATLRSENFGWLRAGDYAHSLSVVRFRTGDWVVKGLRVKVNHFARRPPVSSETPYPLPMTTPRQVRSAHFLLFTDLPNQRAQRLLASLERIWARLRQHFGVEPQGLIHCYVIGDLKQWDPTEFDATAWSKIKQGAGVTVTERQRNQLRSTVFACADEKVVRHEAVHAFCAEAFGDTGPTWYAEGLAELGSYEELRPQIQRTRWNSSAVIVDPVVVDYLRSQPMRTLDSIVAEHQGTGDSWQAYAWRWAACQTLMANPNYSSRFAEYGRALMSSRSSSNVRAHVQAAVGAAAEGDFSHRELQRISLDGFWGLDSHRARFEFQQFVRNVGVGYDPALCAWMWDVPFYELNSGQRLRAAVRARRGWQPSGVRVLKDVGYEYAAAGQWRVDDYRDEVSADGTAHGEGRLSGVILDDQLRLHRPFALGRRGAFRSPATGRLYLRCLDGWTQLHDNSGAIMVHLRRR